MAILNKTGYGYQDITIIPETITDISSRKQCNPLENGVLPIFASPMSTITNLENIHIWEENNITPIIPRNISFDERYDMLCKGNWVALSLSEFEDIFINRYTELKTSDKSIYEYYVCIDLANGHMKRLYELINKAREISKKEGFILIIMTGNIANPKTYEWICKHTDIDYIRLSVGSGFNCITSTQTSIHYPIATLIEECYKIKMNLSNGNSDYPLEYRCLPKIVADGGIRGYADVIKAIGLGADYVMIGSVFTKLLESAGPLNIIPFNSHYNYSFENGIVNDGINNMFNVWDEKDEQIKRTFIRDMKSITKESYGMSTKKAQKLINKNAKMKTSEGCTKIIEVKETVKQWTENMIDYFKSAMSYTNCETLEDFRGQVDFIINSPAASYAINK